MRQFLGDLQKNLIGIWNRLDGGQRLVVGAVMFAAVVGLGAVLWMAGQPSYVSVFEPRSGDDLRDAKRLLSQAGVSTVPDDSGRSILVDHADAGMARSVLIEGGLLDRGSRTMLDGSIVEDAATRQFKLDAAARAQAEAAIGALAGVRSATVTASRPRRSPFMDRDEATQPQATIALRLASGMSFEPLAGSAASLASSQLGVPLANVDVVNAGNPAQRWRYDPDRGTGGGSSEFLTLQRSISEERTVLAQAALEAIHPGKTLVTVGVELDPLWETRSEKVLPPEPIVVSDSMTKDVTENSEPQAVGGDPSIAAATTERQARTNSTKKETRDRKYVTDIGERRSGRLAPEIKRLTVALLYDRSLQEQQGFDEASLAGVVKSIVGWDADRDGLASFSVMMGEFAEPEPMPSGSGPGINELLVQWGPTLGQVLGVLLVLLFLRGLLRTPGRGKAADLEPDPLPIPEKEQAPEEQQRRMRREIERSIANDPAALAKLLESWLAEQKA